MKKTGIVTMLLIASFCLSAKELNVLMIGNSFSICVGKNLPQIVNAGKKHQLTLTSAYIGGCSLETHADHLRSNEKDISFSPYLISEWNSPDAGIEKQREGNVLELLKNNRYDVISIQQASHLSWDYSSYQPYAGKIISCIRKFNPDVECQSDHPGNICRDRRSESFCPSSSTPGRPFQSTGSERCRFSHR